LGRFFRGHFGNPVFDTEFTIELTAGIEPTSQRIVVLLNPRQELFRGRCFIDNISSVKRNVRFGKPSQCLFAGAAAGIMINNEGLFQPMIPPIVNTCYPLTSVDKLSIPRKSFPSVAGALWHGRR